MLLGFSANADESSLVNMPTGFASSAFAKNLRRICEEGQALSLLSVAERWQTVQQGS
jgi:hypothetical protein